MLRLEESEIFTNISLGVNDTRVLLGPNDGLEDNQEYVYTISAINSIGMITTNVNTLCK